MKLTLQQIAAAVGAEPPAAAAEVTSYSIDTRTLRPGALFIALSGERSDGHRYLADAQARGAVAAMVSRAGLRSMPPAPGLPLLVTEDTQAALQRLAAWARLYWGELGGRSRPLVAVTGSAGKTTTKEAIAAVLGAVMRVGKSLGNWNNHLGVPLSLLELPEDADAAVLEIGMNHAGEIRALARIARPTVGVVTNVGSAHVENFGSIEGVALAKRELIEELPPEGCAVLNADDPRVLEFRRVFPGRFVTYGRSAEAEIRAVDVEFLPSGVRFRVPQEGLFETSLAGEHGLSNALAALATARALHIPLGRLREALRGLQPPPMRGSRLDCRGVTVIDDSYNANPEAMRAMLDLLRQTPAGRRIAVLGEMRELGALSEALHAETGRYAARCGLDLLVAVRGDARHLARGAREAGLPEDRVFFFEEPAEAGSFVAQFMRPGDVVLLKGSRGTRMEEALARLLG